MPRTVSASEAKARFGSIADWAVDANDDVIVESHGQPKVAIVPYDEYQRINQLREEARRRDALARLRDLRESVRSRNRDLTEEEADALARRFAREVIRETMGDDPAAGNRASSEAGRSGAASSQS
jgi:prevent-host-death family protein